MTTPTTTPTGSSVGSSSPSIGLHARPRPVTRLSRKAIIAFAALAAMFVFAAMLYALNPPKLTGERDQQELYNVNNKPTAESLDALPKTYRELPPKLGAPLPGNFGQSVLDLEERQGIEPLPATGPVPFQPDPEADRVRAERLRLAQLKQEADESGVLFQISAKTRQSRSDGPEAAVPLGPILGQQADGGEAAQSAAENVPNDQNLQRRKLAFLAEAPETEVYNPHAMQTPASPYQVMAGTILAASLLTGINSDLPGFVTAQITENVYDSVTGSHLLIPQGARLLGRYDSVVAFGQERALVVWNRILLPDGSSIVIDNLPATDRAGYAGLEDKVDFHTWRLIKGIGLSTLLNVGTELAASGEDDSDLERALREGTQDGVSRAGERIVERNLNVQPTIKIRPGWPLRVIVHKDLILRPYRG